MKKLYTFVALLSVVIVLAQAGNPAAYYNGFNWNQTGMTLKNALATKITNTHQNNLSYSDLWSALKFTDQDPDNSQNVLVLYGSTDNTRSLAKSQTCGNGNSSTGCGFIRWNREHSYVQSLGTPDLGQTGPGADAHHMRACAYTLNENRGNRKYASGTGNAGTVGANWYPGNEWKGDVARMIMYMYLRYDSQCLPVNVGVGTTLAVDSNMIDLFLQWNAEDPVSVVEDQRNTYLGNTSNTYGQGNRNPFIDNPYIAKVIWGGTATPENRWPTVFLSAESFNLAEVSVYPNPTNGNVINIQSENNLDTIELISISGQIVQRIAKPEAINHTYTISNMPQGFYLLKLTSDSQSVTKKVIVN